VKKFVFIILLIRKYLIDYSAKVVIKNAKCKLLLLFFDLNLAKILDDMKRPDRWGVKNRF